MNGTLVLAFIISQTVVFAIVFFVLRHLMYKNTMSAVNRLQLVDEENLARIEEMKQKIKEIEDEYLRRKEQLVEDIRSSREQAEAEMKKEKEKIMAKANQESGHIIAFAKKMESNAEQIINERLEAKAFEYAGELTKRVFSERMQKDLDEKLVEELILEISELDASRISIDANDVELVTRYPLKPEQRTKISGLMTKKMGHKIALKEDVNKDMVGGIVLKLGSLVIDGSIENKIKEAAREMKSAKG